MAEGSPVVEIFCCYAREDETWLRKLERHLSLLQRQGLISLWHDRLILPGADWAKALDTHLETASVILLLVSSDFFASDYCYGIEMKRALEREAAGEARVIPILVRSADWNEAPFAHLQALPTDAKPIALWPNKDTALADVAAGIRRVIIEELPQLAASAPRAALPKVWNIPYPRNPFFLGRDTELFQIRQNLHTGQATALSQPQAISGLGGIGKTQLALEYAYRYHQVYAAVLWARAESIDALVSSYITLATLLHLPEREAKEQDITVQAVKVWLQTHRGWLLILDNADELTLLADFLPPSLGGHLLLTTRAAVTGRLAHRLEIETLLPQQGALFLLRRAALIAPDAEWLQASLEEGELALQISQELGGLPLALDQAGAYLEETGMALASYWQIYQQHRADLLHKRGGLVADHPASVATTWSLSFQRVEEKSPAAAELLRLCAFLSPDAIPEEILTVGASFLGPVLSQVAADAFRLNQAIEALRAYSLVGRDPKRKNLSIHRLVQAVLQDTLEAKERHIWAERAIISINAAFPDGEYGTWPQCERLLPHALVATQFVETEQISAPEAGNLLYQTAHYLHNHTRYQEAEPLYQRALRICEHELGPEDSEVAGLLNALANLYREQGKHAEAEPLYQRALRIWKEQFGPESSYVVSPLYNLATLYKEQGKYAKAKLFHQQALRILEEQLWAEHPDMAYPLNGLAMVYREQGQYAEAEPLYLRALRILKEQLGPEHPEVATSLNNLANIYLEQNRHADAEPLYVQALHILEQQLEPDNLHMAYPLAGLAGLYLNQGKHAEAELHCRRSLRIMELHLGPEHFNMVGPLNTLASLYSKQGQYAVAEPFYQRALHILEEQLGSEHPDMAYPLNNLAMLYHEQSKYAEAEPLYQRALHIWERQLGPEHPRVTIVLTNLVHLYVEQGKYTEAEPLHLRRLHIKEQQLGSDHLDVASLLHTLANLYSIQDKDAKAKPLYLRALHIWEQQLGPEHPRVAPVLAHLADLYVEQGKYTEAEPLHLRRLHIKEQQLGSEHPDVASLLHTLANLYSQQGKHAKAEPLYLRALHIWEHQSKPEHPDMAYSLNNLANLYHEQSKYAEAEPLYLRALHIWEQQLGSEHPHVATALNNLASLYSEQSKYAEAEPLYQRALCIHEQVQGPQHPETAETIHDLARFWEEQDNSEEARAWYGRALAVREQALGRHHRKTTETRTRLIALLHVMGYHEEAARLEVIQSESRD